MIRVADGMCELSRNTSGELVADPESEQLSHWEQLINRSHLTVWRKPIQNSYLYEYKGQSHLQPTVFGDILLLIICQQLLVIKRTYIHTYIVHTYMYIHRFNGLFSRTPWVSRHQKAKPFWILPKQEMMGWQWHHLDHMKVICTILQTDNYTSTLSLNFYGPDGLPDAKPTVSKHWRQLVIKHMHIKCCIISYFPAELVCHNFNFPKNSPDRGLRSSLHLDPDLV